MGKTKKCLKSRDNFGYKVGLNFNKQGETVNTLIGGLMSLFLNMVIYSFLALKIFIMFTYADSSLGSFSERTNLDELGGKDYSSLKTLIFFQFKATSFTNLF